MEVPNEKINQFIRNQMFEYRIRHTLSQESMAEQLNIATRCYLEQEKGRCGFSGKTVCHFMAALSDTEILSFVSDLRNVWKEAEYNN